MAETLNDINLTSGAFRNLNTLTGLAKDQRLIIQNKSSYSVLIQIKSTQPTNNSVAGYSLAPLTSCVVYPQGTESVWAAGSGPLYVQIYY